MAVSKSSPARGPGGRLPAHGSTESGGYCPPRRGPGFQAGVALFSPRLTPRRDPCLTDCTVCGEVCPYDAIELRRIEEGGVPVSFVLADKCAGCDFCEHHCLVWAVPATVVESMEALRLPSGSYREAGQTIGLNLSIDLKHKASGASAVPAPWLDDTETPPGFSF